MSDDGYSIFIISTIPNVNFELYNVKVDFAAGLLISDTGIPFVSSSAVFSLASPSFKSSLYNISGRNFNYEIGGIIFLILALMLIICSYWNQKMMD